MEKKYFKDAPKKNKKGRPSNDILQKQMLSFLEEESRYQRSLIRAMREEIELKNEIIQLQSKLTSLAQEKQVVYYDYVVTNYHYWHKN